MKTKEDFLEMIKLADISLKSLEKLEPSYMQIKTQTNKIKEIIDRMQSQNSRIWIRQKASEVKYETNLSKTSRELDEVCNQSKIDITFDNKDLKFDIVFDYKDELNKLSEKQNEKLNINLHDLEKIFTKKREDLLNEDESYNFIDVSTDVKKLYPKLVYKLTKKIKINKKIQKNINEMQKTHLSNFYKLNKQIEKYAAEVKGLMKEIEIIEETQTMYKNLSSEEKSEYNEIIKRYEDLKEKKSLLHYFTHYPSEPREGYVKRLQELKGILNKTIDKMSITEENEQKKSLKNILNRLEKVLNEIKQKITAKKEKSSEENINENYQEDEATTDNESETQKKSLKNILNRLKEVLNEIKQKITPKETEEEEEYYNINYSDEDEHTRSLVNILNKLEKFIDKLEKFIDKLEKFISKITEKITVNKKRDKGKVALITKLTKVQISPDYLFKTNANPEESLEFHSDKRNSLERESFVEPVSNEETEDKFGPTSNLENLETSNPVRSEKSENESVSSIDKKSFKQKLEEERDEKDSSQKEIF